MLQSLDRQAEKFRNSLGMRANVSYYMLMEKEILFFSCSLDLNPPWNRRDRGACMDHIERRTRLFALIFFVAPAIVAVRR